MEYFNEFNIQYSEGSDKQNKKLAEAHGIKFWGYRDGEFILMSEIEDYEFGNNSKQITRNLIGKILILGIKNYLLILNFMKLIFLIGKCIIEMRFLLWKYGKNLREKFFL